VKKINYFEKWREDNPEKLKAYNFLKHCDCSMASACEFCGATENLVRHHPDYDYPEIFVTVCKSCHNWIHHHPI